MMQGIKNYFFGNATLHGATDASGVKKGKIPTSDQPCPDMYLPTEKVGEPSRIVTARDDYEDMRVLPNPSYVIETYRHTASTIRSGTVGEKLGIVAFFAVFFPLACTMDAATIASYPVRKAYARSQLW